MSESDEAAWRLFCFVIFRRRGDVRPGAGSILPYFSYCFLKLMECKEVWSERGQKTQREAGELERRVRLVSQTSATCNKSCSVDLLHTHNVYFYCNERGEEGSTVFCFTDLRR